MPNDKRNKTLSVAYWAPFYRSVNNRATGSGIFHETIISFLSNDEDVRLKLVSVKTGTSITNNILKPFALLWKLFCDGMKLVLARSRILLLSYPAIPLVPYTSNLKFLPAFIFYILLWIKRRLTGQILVTMVIDFPIEQSNIFDLLIGANIRLYNLFEKLILTSSDRIICFSQKFADFLESKHGPYSHKILICARNAYIPFYAGEPSIDVPAKSNKIRVFYSGDLRRKVDISNLKKAIDIIAKNRTAEMFLCGLGGDWLNKLAVDNVKYLGILDHVDYDALASRCDFALIIYPNQFYYNLTPTTKYSAYVGNGLAILSSDTETVAKCIAGDGVGKAVLIEQLPLELFNWINNPELFEGYKKRAVELMPDFRSGKHIKQWFDQVKALARKRNECAYCYRS